METEESDEWRGLIENSTSALKRWMIAGFEFAKLISEFESLCLPELGPEQNYRHHEEGLSTKRSFEKQVSSLVQVIKDYGNPFIDAYLKVLILNTRECLDDGVAISVPPIETLGKLQYEEYKRDINIIPIHQFRCNRHSLGCHA